MKISPIKYIAAILLISFRLTGQDTTSIRGNLPRYDSLNLLYPFLNLSENHIRGDTVSLQQFFSKLARIENGSQEQAVVVHIGDSHVQPGTFTQPTREWMQTEFGDAGRGIMFPYRVAKSNGPSGYISRCDIPWKSGRIATLKRPFPTGIAGYTLWSADPLHSFTVEFSAEECLTGDTTRLIIFHENRENCYSFFVNNEFTGHQYPVLDSSLSNQTTIFLDDQPQKIRIRTKRTKESQRSATFYGMSLESNGQGVIIHTIGVNGAMFASYLESENFVSQLEMLHPDLLIFSLGTNEAFAVKGFSSEKFRAGMDSLFKHIRQTGNNAPVILTTPPGIYRSFTKNRRTSYKPNPVADTVSTILSQYALSNGMALWDWYTIMGGKEAMSKWKAKGLTDRRYIHFSSTGYGIQGVLLQTAFSESYAGYKTEFNN